jgi:hypothetical protein
MALTNVQQSRLKPANVLFTNTTSQSITGGAIVTPANLGITNSTVTTVGLNLGTCPLQYLTNNGAFTCTAPSNDGSAIIEILNGSNAGSITFSGFTIGSSSTGVAYSNTSGYVYYLSVWRVNGYSGYTFLSGQ